MKKDILFLAGVIKSGTTWLQLLVDAHPDIVCKGEGHFATDIAKPLLALLDGYNTQVMQKGGMLAGVHQVSNVDQNKKPDSSHGSPNSILQYSHDQGLDLIRAAINLKFAQWDENNSAKVVGDKTPNNLYNMDLLNDLFPQCKIIHIIRDGRDVAVSAWHFNMALNPGKTIARWGSFSGFINEFASHWKKGVLHGRELGMQKYHDRYLEVRYEDLLTSTDKVLTTIFEFLSVSTDKELIRQCIDQCKFSTVSGGRQPGEEKSGSFFRKGISGDWKNHFSLEDQQVFHKKAGDLMVAMGYVDTWLEH